jgi:hypothetical protein
MAAPERFAKRQIPLAPRAPSIHGPLRHFAAAQQTVAFGGIATVTGATIPIFPISALSGTPGSNPVEKSSRQSLWILPVRYHCVEAG